MEQPKTSLEKFSAAFDENGIVNMSALNLAYVGDAVFELLVRTVILEKNKTTPNELHKTAKQYVKAASQAEMYHAIIPVLTEEELSVIKRGRNAKSKSAAKNASINDYRHATGLEALFGYLYLKGNINRLFELFELCSAL